MLLIVFICWVVFCSLLMTIVRHFKGGMMKRICQLLAEKVSCCLFLHTRKKKQILSKAFWPRNHITSVEIMNTNGINERLKQTAFIHAVALNSRKYALFSFQRICLFVFVWTFNSILFRHSNNCTHSIFRSSYSYTCIFHSKFNPWILNCCFLFYLFFFSFWFDFI